MPAHLLCGCSWEVWPEASFGTYGLKQRGRIFWDSQKANWQEISPPGMPITNSTLLPTLVKDGRLRPFCKGDENGSEKL